MENAVFDFLKGLNTWELILFGLFIFVFLQRLFFDLFFLGKLAFFNKKPSSNLNTGISIIIPARNEEDWIKEYLPVLLSNEYNNFEVIVVDDYSQDQTLILLGGLKQKFKHLKFSSISQDIKFSSKLSLNIGLKSAKNEWAIILYPSVSKIHNNFLDNKNDYIKDNISIIIGYSNNERDKGLSNLLYRVELFFEQIISYAFTLNGVGYLTHEQNITFRKQKYFDIGGFAGEIKEIYVNMEILFNKYIKKKNTLIAFNKENVVRNKQKVSFLNIKEQMIKHLQIKKKLKFWKRLILRFDDVLRLIFLPLLIVIYLLFRELYIVLAIIIGFKLIFHMLIQYRLLNHLNEQKIFIPSLIYELLMPFLRLLFKWFYYYPLQRKHGATR